MRVRRAVCVLTVGLLVATSGLVWSGPAAADQVRDGQWYLDKLGVRQAWSLTRGRGVKVGVVDSGVDGSIPDLRGAVVAGKSFAGAGNGQTPVDGDNHGTNVGSLVAGRGHGAGLGSGVLGTAPDASIISASYSVDTSTDESPQAIRWAVDNGAKVLNLSYVTTFPGQEDAVRYAESKDVVVVASTGDTFAAGQRRRIGMPAAYPGVLAVTGVDENLRTDPGASTGPGTAVAAPFSTTPSNPDSGAATIGLPVANPSNDPAGPYIERTGTSLSAPIVAGIVALVRAQFPDLDAANVINRVLKTATPAGGSVPNQTYGYGVINARAALTAKVAAVTENPLGSLVTVSPSGSATPPPSSSTPPPASGSSTPSAPGSTAPPASGSARSSSAGSSGLGAGAWIAIVAIVIIAGGLIAWLVTRNRRPPPGSAPSGYPPPGAPPPGYPPR